MLKMADIQSVLCTSKRFKISWQMTQGCNYHCTYCCAQKAIAPALNTVLTIASSIDTLIAAAGRGVTLHLLGGEPSLYDLRIVLRQVRHPLLQQVIIITNFSASLDYWKALVAYTKERKLHLRIIASLHLAECDINAFVQKACALQAVTTVKCLLSEDTFAQYVPIISKLQAAGVWVQVTLIRNDMNKATVLSTAQMQYIETLRHLYAEQVPVYCNVILQNGQYAAYYSNTSFINDIEEGGFAATGFWCSAGQTGVRIQPDGALRRASCAMCADIEPLGDIRHFKALPQDPLLCNIANTYKYCVFCAGSSCSRDKEVLLAHLKSLQYS